jgi:excinuclease ABC subunit C
MSISDIPKKVKSLPNSPGVYLFYSKDKTLLYVGKATSLKDRVGSYFLPSPALRAPSPDYGRGGYGMRPIEVMISEVQDIMIKKTDTVLEAYILEQELIKKFQPKYNVDGKDDKSFCYVIITKEEFPRFIILRKTDIAKISNFQFLISKKTINTQPMLKNKVGEAKTQIKKSLKIENLKLEINALFGPYTSRKQIEITLKILRKIFPYHSKNEKTEKGCLDFQIGLCPGPYDGVISKKDYAKNIRGIKMILEGKKKNLIAKLKKEMEEYSKSQEFEKAADARNKVFALQHIQDIALIPSSRDKNFQFPISNFQTNSKFQSANWRTKFRIEGYDISNISGKYAVSSMVVFDNSEGEMRPNKSQYRKFKIKTISEANDVGAMKEVLMRRFRNNWDRPNLILLDGGAGHLNMARRVLRIYKLDIPILAVAKGPKRKKLDLYSFGSVPKIPLEIIEQIRNEAHRFAITYHRKLRGENFLRQ